MWVSIITFASLLLLSTQPQSSTGSIRGTVTSKATGERIIGAEVSLYPPPFITHTDSNGVYRLSKVLDGEYSLTIAAPGYARMTFRGLIVPLFTPMIIDARLGDSASSSDTVIVVKYETSFSGTRTPTEDKMKFYQPDSTIDYKIRIVNPERGPKAKAGVNIAVPDTSREHQK